MAGGVSIARGTVGEVIAAFLFYAILNTFLNFFNAWAMQAVRETKKWVAPINSNWQLDYGGFDFPYVYTFFHTISSTLGARVLMQLRPPKTGWPNFAQFREYIIPIGAIFSCHCTNIALNNASLVSVSLFINQIIKSLAPLPTMVAEYFVVGSKPTLPILCCVVVLVAGACMSIKFDSKENQVVGVICVVVATVASSLKPVFGAYVMKGVGKAPLEPSLILFYEQALSIVIVGIIALCAFNNFKDAFTFMGENPGESAMIIILGSSAAFAYNLSVYYFTRAASALTVMIASNFIKVCLLLLSMLQVSDQMGGVQITGLVIFFISIVAYAYLSHKHKQALAAAAAAAADKGGVEAGLKAPLNESTPLREGGATTCCVVC